MKIVVGDSGEYSKLHLGHRGTHISILCPGYMREKSWWNLVLKKQHKRIQLDATRNNLTLLFSIQSGPYLHTRVGSEKSKNSGH